MALYGVDLNDMEAALFERRGEVAVVTLNRPESANALNTEMHRDGRGLLERDQRERRDQGRRRHRRRPLLLRRP